MATLAEAIDSLHTTMVTDPRDWSAYKRDAWMYAIIVGYPKDVLAKVAAKHHWPEEDVARLRSYRKALLDALRRES